MDGSSPSKIVCCDLAWHPWCVPRLCLGGKFKFFENLLQKLWMDWNQIWTWSPSKIMFVKLSTNKNGHHGLLCILFGFSLKYSNKNSVPYLGKIKVNFCTCIWQSSVHYSTVLELSFFDGLSVPEGDLYHLEICF